jgi:hypothetical protein
MSAVRGAAGVAGGGSNYRQGQQQPTTAQQGTLSPPEWQQEEKDHRFPMQPQYGVATTAAAEVAAASIGADFDVGPMSATGVSDGNYCC